MWVIKMVGDNAILKREGYLVGIIIDLKMG